MRRVDRNIFTHLVVCILLIHFCIHHTFCFLAEFVLM